MNKYTKINSINNKYISKFEKKAMTGDKNSIVLNNGKIKLYSRKLASGKCQIKFHWDGDNMEPVYGYLLTEGNRTFSDVIREIRKEVDRAKKQDWYYHRHLYQLGAFPEYRQDLMIFKDKNNDNSC